MNLSLSLPQLLLRFLAIIITACVSNPWVLIPAVVVMAMFLLLRTYYLKTSRDIKRLEAVGKGVSTRCVPTAGIVSMVPQHGVLSILMSPPLCKDCQPSGHFNKSRLPSSICTSKEGRRGVCDGVMVGDHFLFQVSE